MSANGEWSSLKWLVTTALVLVVVHLAVKSGATAEKVAPAIPRTSEGKPDFTGIWQTLSTAEWDLEPHAARKDAPPGLGVVEGNVIPYQPAALAKRNVNFQNRDKLDPRAKSNMLGVPRVTYNPAPFQILQQAAHVTLVYEYQNSVRTIYTNGSAHPPGHIDWWLGDSRGHWEGDTLVADVIDFNDETWLDHSGNFHSDALHVIEKYTYIDTDHNQYEATLEDPHVFTRPCKISLILYRHREKNLQLLENYGFAFDYEKYYP